MNGTPRTPRHLLASLLLAVVLPAAAQNQLGMDIVGDDDAAFGLLISNWMEDEQSRLLAPGFIEEKPETLDPWMLDMHLQALDAVGPAPRAAAGR